MHKCTPQEIIREVPYVQTLRLPDDWFQKLEDTRSVFVSLYEWMLEKGRVSSQDKRTLPGRTYVGEKLFKKLLAAEKKRLKKILKIKGEELDSALVWSDINSGPKTELGDCKINGDVILVIPEASRQRFGELSSKIFKRQRESKISKIRANAAGATFYHWLLSQSDRPDRVGDLARDAAIDESFPREGNQYIDFQSCLDSQGASSAAIESLKEGWLEYVQQYPERVTPYAWCSECGMRIDVKNAMLAWSLESNEIFSIDAVCLDKCKRYDAEIKSRPLYGITFDDLKELAERDEVSEHEIEDLIEKLRLWGVLPVNIGGSIYFIKSENNDAIKIGFTTRSVEDRLRSLQTAHPYKLTLVATMPGTIEHERALHKKYGAHRLEGEWFRPHPDLLVFISILLKAN